MKKLLSVIISAIMIVMISITSFAAENSVITQDNIEKKGSITVDYNMKESYTVTIPASISFTDTQKTVERALQVEDIAIKEGSSLRVNVSSMNNFKMKNNDAEIDYSLVVNTHDIAEENNQDVLVIESGEKSGWAILHFKTDLSKNKATYSGNYSDTLTFTVSVG